MFKMGLFRRSGVGLRWRSIRFERCSLNLVVGRFLEILVREVCVEWRG